MKALLICVTAMLFLGALWANPITPRALSRVWFDSAGDFNVSFGYDAGSYYLEYLPSMAFSTTAGTFNWPAGFVFPVSLPWAVNLSQTLPGFTINRTEDRFSVTDSLLYGGTWHEALSWGPQNDLSIDLHPLTEGQSAAQVFVQGMDTTIAVWAKDIGVSPYSNPSHLYTLNVHADAAGNPAPEVPIRYSFSSYLSTYFFPYYSDLNGNWSTSIYAARTRLMIHDPITQLAVVDTILFPEPDEVIQINAEVSSVGIDDPFLVATPGILMMYPSVLNSSSDNTLKLSYDGASSLSTGAEIHLYDLRGRKLLTASFPAKGKMEWNLPYLANGIYFISLTDTGKRISRQRLTVIR
ncbi:MAG: hypothetical protein CVU48_06755 [Candidatus Cloacimonetes bacterium HGW-Cloacimonetes-1]|nr:MAG: hypothetical protein CVU48_06755 [Candidatus Cloacimonetes bacterium HGW-Cloacimonetes-1]